MPKPAGLTAPQCTTMGLLLAEARGMNPAAEVAAAHSTHHASHAFAMQQSTGAWFFGDPAVVQRKAGDFIGLGTGCNQPFLGLLLLGFGLSNTVEEGFGIDQPAWRVLAAILSRNGVKRVAAQQLRP